MKIKKSSSFCEMRDQVMSDFSEYLDEGANPIGYLLSLLHQEREKNSYLQEKLDYITKRNPL